MSEPNNFERYDNHHLIRILFGALKSEYKKLNDHVDVVPVHLASLCFEIADKRDSGITRYLEQKTILDVKAYYSKRSHADAKHIFKHLIQFCHKYLSASEKQNHKQASLWFFIIQIFCTSLYKRSTSFVY